MAEGRSITLTPTETRFVSLLDDFANQQRPQVECRIAGGWVRDKLLQLQSHDLDIALSIPSAYAFAESFVQFLKSQDIPVGSVGRVAANPEQSKHLETGTTRILGLECDFVGLRSETYTDSRIPDQVKLGTPLEDALRRDLTINSLFYNVHSKLIEDHTGLGLSDLDNRIARTPLPPHQTFFDDPLRVLRCVRFASRFELAVEKEVADAIMDPEIQTALRTKVSKERVGIEIRKMLQPSKHPLTALRLIDQLGLYNSIFTVPGHDLSVPIKDALQAGLILQGFVSPRTAGIAGAAATEGDDFLWAAAACCPFRHQSLQIKGKDVPAVSVVIQEGLKLPTDFKNAVTALLAAPTILDPRATSRSEIGVMLQHQAVRPWTRSVMWACVNDILNIWQGVWDSGCDDKLAIWREFVGRIGTLDLEKDIDRPPLIDGKSLQRLLDLKPGPLLQVILKAINVYQLDHPGITREECEAWLLDRWSGPTRDEWEAAVPLKAESPAKRKR